MNDFFVWCLGVPLFNESCDFSASRDCELRVWWKPSNSTQSIAAAGPSRSESQSTDGWQCSIVSRTDQTRLHDERIRDMDASARHIVTAGQDGCVMLCDFAIRTKEPAS